MEQVDPQWRKATYSGNGGANCVEAGQAPGAVLVRDTTDRAGFTMPVSPAAWSGLLSSIRTGKLDDIG